MKCRCNKTRKRLILYSRAKALPPDLRAAIETCPECSTFWARTRQVADLLALKRFEQPDDVVLERCRTAVRRQIAARHEEPAEEARETLWAPAPFMFRFGMAALLVALLGLHLLSSSPFPAIHTTERSIADCLHDARTQAEAQVAQEKRPHPEFNIMMLSNWNPRIQHDSAISFVGFDR